MASTNKTIDLGNGMTAILNAFDYAHLYRYSWRAVKHGRAYYAKTTVGKGVKRCDLSMHRMVAHTPFGMVCHHRNRNSLDNRLENLINMTRQDHDMLHKNNSLCIKFADRPHPSPSELLSQPKTNFLATEVKNPNF